MALMRVSTVRAGVLPQHSLELCEGHLDGVHVRAVGRQVEELGAACGDGFADAGSCWSRSNDWP